MGLLTRIADDNFAAGTWERRQLEYLLTFSKYRAVDRTLLCDIIEDLHQRRFQ